MNRPARNGPETVQLASPREGTNRERKRADWRETRAREETTEDRKKRGEIGREKMRGEDTERGMEERMRKKMGKLVAAERLASVSLREKYTSIAADDEKKSLGFRICIQVLAGD